MKIQLLIKALIGLSLVTSSVMATRADVRKFTASISIEILNDSLDVMSNNSLNRMWDDILRNCDPAPGSVILTIETSENPANAANRVKEEHRLNLVMQWLSRRGASTTTMYAAVRSWPRMQDRALSLGLRPAPNAVIIQSTCDSKN